MAEPKKAKRPPMRKSISLVEEDAVKLPGLARQKKLSICYTSGSVYSSCSSLKARSKSLIEVDSPGQEAKLFSEK